MNINEVYDALRWHLREGELQAFLAAIEIVRASPNLSPEDRDRAVRHWFVAYIIAPERCLQPRQFLDFEALSPEKFRSYFRFGRHHIRELRVALGVPDAFATAERTINGDIALLMLLRKMATPQRLVDLEDEFGCSRTTLSDVTLSLIEFLHDRWKYLLYNAGFCFQRQRLASYAQAVCEKIYILCGVRWPADTLWQIVAFLDGSFHKTNRPSDEYRGQDLQASAYSGYEKAHGMRFHHLLFPCGIIGHVSLLIAGRQNDAALWAASRIEELLRRHLPAQYRVLTDMGYARSEYIAMPVRSAQLDRDIRTNKLLASIRVPVEWSFGRVNTLWAGVIAMLQIRKTPIAKWYHISVLLTNCWTCLYGSACSDYFDMLPPLLEEYLVYTHEE